MKKSLKKRYSKVYQEQQQVTETLLTELQGESVSLTKEELIHLEKELENLKLQKKLINWQE